MNLSLNGTLKNSMGILDRKTKCCGSDLAQENISILGVVSFSFPLVVILFPIWVINIFVSALKINLPIKIVINSLVNSNLKLINMVTLFPNLKCKIAAVIYRISPYFSGFIFKWFNFILILIVYILLIQIGFLINEL